MNAVLKANFIMKFDFQKLEVYKKSKLFHLGCNHILHSCKQEKYVSDQLGKASFSIVLNIAEGSAKSTKPDRRNFFTISRGSVFEFVAILDLLFEQQLIPINIYESQMNLADEVSKMLYTMIKNLES